MDPLATYGSERDHTQQAVQAFYDAHPYPPPLEELDGYRRRWQDAGQRRADFHLHWPEQPYRANLRVLVAGCGTSQAAWSGGATRTGSASSPSSSSRAR